MIGLETGTSWKTVVDFYLTGKQTLLQSTQQNHDIYALSPTWHRQFESEPIISFLEDVGKRSYLKNPDLFFALMQYGEMEDNVWDRKTLSDFMKAAPKDLLELLIKPIVLGERSQKLNERLAIGLRSEFKDDDEALKARASECFQVTDLSLAGQTEPFIYTKINHGYWEFLLNSFVPDLPASRFRDLSHSRHPAFWRDSGFHAALLDAFSSLTGSSSTKIGISLSAGERPYRETMAENLGPVGRGAMNGLLGFIHALQPGARMSFVEGSAPRDLLRNDDYKPFLDEQLNQHDAVVLLVPPPLRDLSLPRYAGKIHRLVVPGQVVHETYRVLIPTLIGLLQSLGDRFSSICVLTQSAVLAPLAAISIDNLLSDSSARISFYDLGRVLDIVHPESLKTYPSLAWVVESGIDRAAAAYLARDEKLGNYGICRLDG